MAYGTPTGPDNVEAYYTRIRHGHAPTPEQLADLQRRYNAIGGVSPLAERTAAQVSGIRESLERSHPGRFTVFFGAKYADPLIEDAARELVESGITSVTGLVLAPHESSMSTGQYMSRAQAALGDAVTFRAIGAWWDEPVFVELLAERVRDQLATIDAERRDSAVVIFSAHSLPSRIVGAGDTYPDQLAASAQLVADAAGLSSHLVAFQSAGRTQDEWLGPDILEVLTRVRESGASDVVVCPIGFVSDHLEVLFDIDVEAKARCDELGLALYRTPSLNDDPAFTAMLADLVARTA
jgi:ferrochelatase